MDRKDLLIPLPNPTPYATQGIEVPGTRRPGQTGHYQNGIWGYIDSQSPRILTTVDQVFLSGLKRGRDINCLGHRPKISSHPLKYANYYVWQTYGQVDTRRRRVGSALEHLFRSGKLGGGEYETVGIFSANLPEWQIIDVACSSYAKVCVSLYDTLGADSFEYIINHANITILFCTSDHISSAIKQAPNTPDLRIIVSIDPLLPESSAIYSEWSQTHNIQIMQMSEFEALGEAHLIEPIPATPEQLCTICYTSGTTGNPKGVMLKHRSLALSVSANFYGFDLPAEPCMMSYLPLAHIYGRMAEMAMLCIGGCIGYWRNNPLGLLEDANILRPHFFPSVPRVLNRVYQAAMVAAEAPGVKGALFRKALQVKLDNLNTTGSNTHAFWDRLVFRKISAVLGGNILLILSGSAPISVDVMKFLKIAFSCEVLEGWGMTETCASGLKNVPGDPSSSGTVGGPTPGNEIKLIDVPSMNYSVEDKPNGRGELCMRGDMCFSEYYKDPKNTKETVDEDGWIHTGDIAEVDSCGRFKIIDRIKNIMKLAQGEYVALEKIENTYATSPAIAQVFVHGDSLQSFLLAVIVPDPIQLASIASSVLGKDVFATDMQQLAEVCLDERVNTEVLKTLTKLGKKNGLKGFECVKRIHLTLNPFSVEENTMTPTLKLRRKEAYQKFKKELDALYQLGDQNLSKL